MRAEERQALVVTGVGDDGIIDDTTIFLADERQSTFSGLQLGNIADEDSLEELNSVLTSPPTVRKEREKYLI